MKRTICLAALLFTSQFMCSQLTVKPSVKGKSSFVYVKGKALYVTNDVQLVRNPDRNFEAGLYLRNDAQLLQGEQQKKENSGTGLLSVFQEGTSNGFDYNYWGSPVSAPENDYFGISMLGAPADLTNSVPALITSALNGLAEPLTISNRWIYTFSGNDYSSWNYIGGNKSISKGYGFSMKGVDGKDSRIVDGRENNPGNAQRYDFRGRPNSGPVEVPIVAEEFVLVGNPYPSAVDLSLFLLENSGSGSLKTSCHQEIQRNNVSTGIAYFWDSEENGSSHYLAEYIGGYGAFSPVDPCTEGIYEKPIFMSYGNGTRTSSSSGKDIKRRFLPIAQGFMMYGVENGNIRFRNSQRAFVKEGNNSEFKTAEGSKGAATLTVIPKMRIEATINKNYVRSFSLAFWPMATSDIDVGMDAAAYDEAPADVGFLQQGQNFVIDVRPFDLTSQIPLYLKAETDSTQFTFKLATLENFSTKNILIFDSESGTYHDLSEEPLDLVLQKGDYSGRFKIAFMEEFNRDVLPEELEVIEKETIDFSVFQNNYMQELEIISDLFPVKSVGIFDLQGKRLFFRSNFQNKRSIAISSANWAPGIYIVKITNNQNEMITKKISVFKSK